MIKGGCGSCGGETPAKRSALPVRRRRDHPFGYEPLERARPVARHDVRQGLVVFGNHYLLTFPCPADVLDQIVSQYLDSYFWPLPLVLDPVARFTQPILVSYNPSLHSLVIEAKVVRKLDAQETAETSTMSKPFVRKKDRYSSTYSSFGSHSTTLASSRPELVSATPESFSSS